MASVPGSTAPQYQPGEHRVPGDSGQKPPAAGSLGEKAHVHPSGKEAVQAKKSSTVWGSIVGSITPKPVAKPLVTSAPMEAPKPKISGDVNQDTIQEIFKSFKEAGTDNDAFFASFQMFFLEEETLNEGEKQQLAIKLVKDVGPERSASLQEFLRSKTDGTFDKSGEIEKFIQMMESQQQSSGVQKKSPVAQKVSDPILDAVIDDLKLKS